MEYVMNNNYLELITETTNFTSPVYKEAAESVDKNDNKGLAYFKNFMTSIENLANKENVNDKRISSSKGNVKDFKGYDDIKTAIAFINKNLGSLDAAKDCTKVFDALENWSSLYQDGYKSNIRLIQLEYENAVYLLSTTLSEILATNMDVVANGVEIKFSKKNAKTHGVIQKTMKDLASQLGDRSHKDYLEGLLKIKTEVVTESVYMEDAVGVVAAVKATLDLIAGVFSNGLKIFKSGKNIFITLKRSLFGIVPIIRSILYIRYKKKADTILSLEEQIIFIERNIDQLKNIKTMDPNDKAVIIKKQQAVIERYKKKSEKLRAELMETEKQATEAINEENPTLKDTSGELVLEAAIFMDKAEKIEESTLEELKKSWEKGNDDYNAAMDQLQDKKIKTLEGMIKNHDILENKLKEVQEVIKDNDNFSKDSNNENAKKLNDIKSILAGL